MRWSGVFLLSSLLICAVCLPAMAASPVIIDLEVDRGRDVSSDGAVSYHERVSLYAYDTDGVADVVACEVTDSTGTLHTLGPEGGPGVNWALQTECCIWIQWEYWQQSTPPPPGSYAVAVWDADSNSDAITTAAAPVVPELTPELLTPPPDSSVVVETEPFFSWVNAIPGSWDNLHIWDDGTGEHLWHYWTDSETSVTYNADGGASLLSLIPGRTYWWQIDEWKADDYGVTDPRVRIMTSPHAFGRFTVYRAEPTILDVYICPGRDTDAPDWAKYHRRAAVRVTDADGADDIVSITITDANGVDHVKMPWCGCWWPEDDYTVSAGFCEEDLLSPPGGDSYTVVVTDASANTDTVVTAVVPVASDVHPEPVSPVMDSVIYDTAPTFSWNAGLPGSSYSLHLEEEGTLGEIWSVEVGESPDPVIEVPYGGVLQPNHAYFWSTDAWRPEDVRVSDPRVEIWASQWTRARFTVYGDWPELPPVLPGMMLYGAVPWAVDPLWEWGMPRVVQYDTDPSVRTWPEYDGTWMGEWSPDGSKLLFPKAPGIWIDYLDGSDPYQIPALPGWGEAHWAPDGERIVFEFWGPENPDLPANYDIWVSNLDGTDVYPIVETYDTRDRFPAWSPDGLWIAYRKLPEPDPNGLGIHLVRYDGTEDHALLMTSIVGYPGYELTYAGEQTWSPDGLQLATTFAALGPDETEISGIGRVSRDGGALTPVFVSPPGYVCCAGVHLPQWSPDGTQIVFSSAHHAPDPAGEAEFEPRVELWLANADGSGEPVRLTYDYSFDSHASWWAPNTVPETPGDPVTVTAGDTTVSFESVESGGTTTAVTFDEPPGPDPGGFQFLGDYYDISTTAELEPGSKITIEIHYDDADVPGGEEEWLSLLHWEDDAWVDITVRPIDTVGNIITGECTSLSAFGIAFGPQFIGLLPPVNNDGSSVFKLKRTVPVKFQLQNPDGSFVADALAKLYIAKVSNDVVGSYEEPESTSAADSGNTFRYDADADQYIFNLGTKGLSTGTWVLQVMVNGMVAKEVWVSLR